MPWIGIFMILALAAMGVGWFWTIAVAFQKSILLGFLCMFWPVSIVFGLTDGKQSRRAAGVAIVGIVLGIVTGLFGPLAT